MWQKCLKIFFEMEMATIYFTSGAALTRTGLVKDIVDKTALNS